MNSFTILRLKKKKKSFYKLYKNFRDIYLYVHDLKKCEKILLQRFIIQ